VQTGHHGLPGILRLCLKCLATRLSVRHAHREIALMRQQGLGPGNNDIVPESQIVQLLQEILQADQIVALLLVSDVP
jgi:hypothetical protein